MLRCAICDYTIEEGSDYADLAPGRFKLHPTPHGDFLCDGCADAVDENLYDLGLDDEETDSD